MEKVLTLVTLFAIASSVSISKTAVLNSPFKVINFDKEGATKYSDKEPTSRHNGISCLNCTYTDTEECPTWMYRANGSSKCTCGVDYYHKVKCDQLHSRVYILNGYRMTYNKVSGEEILGASPYGINSIKTSSDGSDIYLYHIVPNNRSQLNEAMCGKFNREGMLCGGCKEGYSPLVYSYSIHCIPCSSHESKRNILKFVCVALLPLTAFYIVVVIFKFNANSPALHGFILFAQIISTPSLVKVMLIYANHRTGPIKALATLYGIWNLDFFRTLYPDICLQVTALQAMALDYIVAFYPLLLILLTLAMFKLHSYYGCQFADSFYYPLEKCLSIFKLSKTKNTSIIDVFATFLLLSYGRIMSVSFNLLFYTSAVNSRGKVLGRYLYYDTTYRFLGKEHLPYGALALFLFTVFNVLPLLLLLFYPMKWFQKCLNRFKLSSTILHTFVDSFAGCYKDGTEPGVRDCRYFAALSLFVRTLFYISYEALKTDFFFGISGIIVTVLLTLYAVFQPYKAKYSAYNKVTTVMIAVMVASIFSTENITVAHNKMYEAITTSLVIFGFIVLLPLLYITAVTVKWMAVNCLVSLLPKAMKFDRETEEISEESLLIQQETRISSTVMRQALN